MREAIATTSAPAAIGPYSQAIRAGDFLFVSGQIPLDPASGVVAVGDIRAQTARVLDNLGAILAAAGGSFDQVVKTTVFLADMADFAAMNEVYARRFQEAFPARSTIQVAGLPKGSRIEVEVHAVRHPPRKAAKATKPKAKAKTRTPKGTPKKAKPAKQAKPSPPRKRR